MKKSLSAMVDYLPKRNFADNLAAAAQPISYDDLAIHILGVLGSEYDALVVSITSRTDGTL